VITISPNDTDAAIVRKVDGRLLLLIDNECILDPEDIMIYRTTKGQIQYAEMVDGEIWGWTDSEWSYHDFALALEDGDLVPLI